MERDPTADLELEVQLMQRLGKGDRQSFAELYDRFSSVLFSIACRVLNNHEAAQDVLQEVFVQIWEKAPLYDPARGKPLTWAITLTRNKAIDRLRTTQRRSRLREDLEKEASAAEQFDDKSSLAAVQSVEQGALVRAALTKLPREQIEALELAFFAGLTQVEIAERLQTPLGTVKARIRRGMMRLRELLEPPG